MTATVEVPEATATDGTTFAPGGEFTVGAEEELLLVDERNELLSEPTAALVDRLAARMQADGAVTTELFGAEIEFATPVCTTADQLWASLAAFRSRLLSAGARPLAVGAHPAGAFGTIDLTRSQRYDTIGSSLAGLLRTPTAALQVHVGMPDPVTAMTAFRGLRHRLALLRALAAGSPYWHGQDSGLASARWAVVRSYPRSGMPPSFASWDQYVAVTDALTDAAEVPDYTHVWWDLRAQPRLGTLEVRVMDVQPSLDTVAGLAALVQGLARFAAERPLTAELPDVVLDENDFRVARHGLGARITDVDGTMRPVRDLAFQAVVEARSALAPDGLDAPLVEVERILSSEPEYARQRRIATARGLDGLLDDLAARTAAGA